MASVVFFAAESCIFYLPNTCSFKSNRSKYLNKRKIYKLIEKDNLKTDWSKRIFFYYKPINKEDIKIKVIPILDSIMLETIKKRARIFDGSIRTIY